MSRINEIRERLQTTTDVRYACDVSTLLAEIDRLNIVIANLHLEIGDLRDRVVCDEATDDEEATE